MTLTVAIHLNDFIVLVGDQRLTVEYESVKQAPAKVILDDYQKIRYWKHGAIVVSGSVLLMHYFYELLNIHAASEPAEWQFLAIAQIARAKFLNIYKGSEEATGTAFFSLFNNHKVELIHLSINEDGIQYETIQPMFAHFSVFAGTPDDPIYQLFVDALRQQQHFAGIEEFYNYHIELIKIFYKRQASFDESITCAFDVFIQNVSTGVGFMQNIAP